MLTPPKAKKVLHTTEIHGLKLHDYYHWMRDDSRTNDEVLSHLHLENEYHNQYLEHTAPLQDDLYNEIIGRIDENYDSVPHLYNGYWYMISYREGLEHPVHRRRLDEEGSEFVDFFDVNKLAEGTDYISIGSVGVHPKDPNLVAYTIDITGRRLYQLVLLNLETNTTTVTNICNAEPTLVWADGGWLFFTTQNDVTLLSDTVCRYNVETGELATVYVETDPTFHTAIGKTSDKQYVVIYHSHTDRSGCSVIPSNSPSSIPHLVHEIAGDHRYYILTRNDEYFIVSNVFNRNNGIFTCNSIEELSNCDNWKPLLWDLEDNEVLDTVSLLKDFIAFTVIRKGYPELIIMDRSLNYESIAGGEFDDIKEISIHHDPMDLHDNRLRYWEENLVTPDQLVQYDIKTGERTIIKTTFGGENHDPSDYVCQRLMVPSRDKRTMIPVTIAYKKSAVKLDGTAPMYQYAYGSYGLRMEVAFSPSIFPLLDRGHVYALAHPRGCDLMGDNWYQDGKMFNKWNTFTDFADVTDALVKGKYCDPTKVVASGGSAGGLLMGVIANTFPSKYLGIVASVPFVDVINTMLDDTLPLTTIEYDQWGDPNNEDCFRYMLSYSPYDNVREQPYPNLLVTTGLHDSQVQYFEPMKWVAKLREHNTSDNTILFKTNMSAGHGGSSGRYSSIKEHCIDLAFVLDLTM